jgi:TonB-dependent receptor
MSISISHDRSRLTWALLSLIFFTVQFSLAAGSGSIKGRVLDRETGDPLPGANIVVQSTSIGISTDLEGRFTLHNVPEGNQTLRVSYIGYIAVTREVTVDENATLEEEFRLSAQAITGETVVVTAQAQGQNAAINQQLASNTIANIVSAARIKELPDVNAAESIGRLPGVAINRSGGEANTVAIRGLSAKYNLVTVNGVRLPSTGDDRGVSLTSSIFNNGDLNRRSGGNDRSADLSLISSNMLDGIELKKANTPDMDADVLGGTVDLKLKEAPDELQINVSAQGGYNNLQKYYGNYNFAGTVSNRFLDRDLGIIASANTDEYDRSADKFSGSYRQLELTNTVIQTLDMREEKVTRGRTGGSLLLDYRIPYGKVTSNVFFNRLRWDGLYRINRLAIDASRHYYDLEDRHGTTDIFTGAAAIKLDFDWIRLDAGAARTTSRGKNPNEHTWTFSQEQSPYLPAPDQYTHPDQMPQRGAIDSSHTGLADIYVFDTNRDDNQTTVQGNVEMPFFLGDLASGYIKTGGKLRWLDRMNDEDAHGVNNLQYGGTGGLNNQMGALLRSLTQNYPDEWDWSRDSALARRLTVLPITRFLSDYSRPDFLNGEYPLGFGLDVGKLNRVTEALRETQWYMTYSIQSRGRDYDGIERYQAGYIMGEFNLGESILYFPVTVLGGVRYERDYSLYHGQRYRAVTTGGVQQGAPLDLEVLTTERRNDFWLPMVHLTLRPADWLKVRLAGTQTLSRPDYRQYAPITFISANQDRIGASNSNLRPARSTNFDAAISVFNNSIGLFSVSGFYKRINDLVFSSRYDFRQGIPIPEGSNIPDRWVQGASPSIYSYDFNNPFPAIIKGVELEWQTHFWYLPSVFRGLVLNVNLTRIFSEVEIRQYYIGRGAQIPGPGPPRYYSVVIDSSRTARVPDQPAYIANVTLGYDYEGFSTRLSYLYQDDRVSGIDRNPGLDSFTGAYARWDLTVQQTLFDWGVQIFANFTNLNKRPDQNFRGYQLINPTYTEYYGFTMDVGVRYKL